MILRKYLINTIDPGPKCLKSRNIQQVNGKNCMVNKAGLQDTCILVEKPATTVPDNR